MADWSVLGLSGDPVPGDPVPGDPVPGDPVPGDPVPGDPAGVRALAARLGGYAELVRSNTERAREVASEVLGSSLQAQDGCNAKYVADLGELPELLGKLGTAYQRCADALSRYAGSLEEAQIRSAVTQAANAAADQQLARRLADEAVSLRDGAVTRCEEEIDAALEGRGIKNKAGDDQAGDVVHAPFRSWDAFVDLCGEVALVAGVVALFISGPIGWALMKAALVVGAVLPADTLHKYATGKADLLEVGLAVLGVFPGARGVVSVTKLAGTARRLGSALAREGSKSLGGGAFGLWTAIPHGLAIAGGIRSAARDPGLFARAVACRAFKADSVDVATGELFIDVIDVSLPGSLPFAVRRIHQSSYQVGHTFGSAWVTNLDHRLEVDDAGVAYLGDDGTLPLFPHTGDGEMAEPGEGARLRLRADPDADGFTVTDPLTGVSEHFAPLTGMPGVTALPLVATTDRAGRRIDYGYDADGYLTEIVHAGGYRIRVTRTSGGLVSGLVLVGRTPGERGMTLVRYGYDPAGRLTEVVNSSGLAMRYSYDPVGRLVRWEDRNGTWYQYGYDEVGRVVRAEGTDAILRAQFSYQPAAAGGVGGPARTVFTDSLGQAWTYETNEVGQVTAAIDPTGARTVQEWDRYHRLLGFTDPIGRITSHGYDEVGNLVRTTLPDGHQVTTRYNTDDLPVSVRLPDGTVWSADYDSAGLLLSRSDPDAGITRYAYDDRGHLTTVVDALDQVTQVVCDPAGLPVAVTDPTGASTNVIRDAFGRPVTITDPLGAVTRLDWTVEGHLRERVDPDGAVWAWTYDGEENLRAGVDPAGRVTTYVSTPFDQITRVEASDGAVTQYVYDTERRLTTVINPQGLRWRYTRDPRGLVVAETDVNGATTSYDRDAAGQVVRRTNAVGQTIEFTYDARGNPVSQHTSDTITSGTCTSDGCTSDGVTGEGTATWWEYDVLGQLVRATNPEVDLRLTRDGLGRITAETTNGHTLASVFDVLGRRTHRTTPTGVTSQWVYDPAGRPVALTTGGHTIDFAWDATGNPITRRFGVTSLYQAFDPPGRLRTQTLTPIAGRHAATPRRSPHQSPHQSPHPAPRRVGESAPLLHREHTYTLDGYLTRVTDLHTGTRRYLLDPVGQVAAVTGPQGSERYSYDPAGNIVDAAWPAPSATAGDDPDPGARGRREYAGTLIRRAGSYTYTHDQAGRLARRRQRTLSGRVREWTYTWDAHDRLIGVTTPDGSTWRYIYDPLGRRSVKQRLDPGGITVVEETRFTWDGPVLVEEVHSPTGAVTTWDYQPATFIPVAQQTGKASGDPDREPGTGRHQDQDWYDRQFHAIVTDFVGAPSALVASDGRLTRQPDTTLWGTSDGSGHDMLCPLRFPGHYHDRETGHHYNVLRHYDPATARYTSPDPIGLLGGPNPHGGPSPHGYLPHPLEWIDQLGSTYVSRTSKRLSDPLTPGLSKRFVNTYDEFRLGNGVPALDPHGAQKVFQGRDVWSRKWSGSLEFRVSDTADRYRTTRPFTAPYLPDGW